MIAKNHHHDVLARRSLHTLLMFLLRFDLRNALRLLALPYTATNERACPQQDTRCGVTQASPQSAAQPA